MLEGMNLVILIGAGLIALSIFTSLASFRIGAPLLLVFLSLGLLVGEDGLGLEFDNAPVAYFIGSIALAIILFDSGFATRLRTLRVAAAPAVVLATVGVVLTSALMAVAAHALLGLGWIEALLMGAVVGSTDAAAVFFLLRVGGITLRERVRSTLEIESGSNDPMAIFLTITLVELLLERHGEAELAWTLARTFVLQFGVGAALGLAGGWLIVQVVNRVELEQGLHPLVVLSLALLLFASVNMLGGSGFLAVYVAGIVSGNSHLRRTEPLRRFQEGMTWLCQIVMFLLLGLLATPSKFMDLLVPGVALGLLLIFLARPLAIWLCLLPFGFTRNEVAFIGWVGLRGAVSILLAILPLMHGLEVGQRIFNATFLVVLTSLLIQGWTIRPAARRLHLVVPPRRGALERFELDLPGAPHHELVVYHIREESPVARGERLPRWARPALIVRGGRMFDVHGAGRLQADDYVYIFTRPRWVGLLDRLFASRTALGRNEREFFGDFVLAADAPLAELARTYAFEARPEDRALTVRQLLEQSFGGGIEPGDRLPYGAVELVVHTLDDEERVATVGLVLDPAHAASWLPSPGELVHRLLGAWRRPARPPPAP
ncbi:MAG TPA: potassium/proton antiporter [Geminicoccaceae bacterium]|nr:potassium/proton antiporter [Geminicoccaceae bacterium]